MSSEPTPAGVWSHFQGTGQSYGFVGSHGRHAHLLRKIARLCAGAAPTVLNVGIGDGNFERQSLKRGWLISTLDPDEQAVQSICKAGVDAKAGSITAIPWANEQFDFVVVSEVLEHLTPEQRSKAIQEIHRTLKPGGRLIGTVPFQENLNLAITVCPQCNHVFHRWGHTTSFDLETMRKELAIAFSDIQCYRAALVEFAGRNLTGKAKSLARWILGKFGAAITVPSLVFLARKT
jgi:2-polyprenyl-3-methyl-5-hydroxy-6-metoxy-1,4-benzoquinol methylase